jgi:hypothetical protein
VVASSTFFGCAKGASPSVLLSVPILTGGIVGAGVGVGVANDRALGCSDRSRSGERKQ